jgi:carbon monoxide dehydrogenase subunit G
VLETQQTFTIDAPIEEVWAYVCDISNWATSMPGYQSFEEVDERNSKWVIKVALGALTRTVLLDVQITEWREPDRVAFSLRGENDPVEGDGTFAAIAADGVTDITFVLAISGNGPMAATMEAMSRPVVPRMASAIGESLKRAIEEGGSGSDPETAGQPFRVQRRRGRGAREPAGPLSRFWRWLRGGRRKHAPGPQGPKEGH